MLHHSFFSSKMAAIGEITSLIEKGIAYQVDVPDVGSFVCLDFAAIRQRMPFHVCAIEGLKLPPVWYPCLDGHTRSFLSENSIRIFDKKQSVATKRMDYALWAPYADGTLSPWGRGQPTVNLQYMLPVF
jgi:cysteinyl-tRNA synthetase